MNLSKREKIIAGGVGVAVVAYLVSAYLIAPYFGTRDDLNNKIGKARVQQKKDADLLANKNKVAEDWQKITAQTVTSQPALGVSKISSALFDWARSARFNIQTLKPDRAVQKGDFQQIQFQVNGAGSTIAVSAFLRVLETTDLPVRIEKLRINPRKEGVDDLSLTLTLNTIVFSPPATTKSATKTPVPKGDAL